VADELSRGDVDLVRLITAERDGYFAERDELSERFIANVNLYPSVATGIWPKTLRFASGRGRRGLRSTPTHECG
jgi:hypothetical protein